MKISEATRRDIIDSMLLGEVSWAGRLDEPEFLSRIFDLKSLPSNDHRFDNAYRDIWQHRVNNAHDWDDDWVFHDSRFDLLWGDDTQLLAFLCETLHPVVRSDAEETERLRQMYNHLLRRDGYELVERGRMAGRPVFAARLVESVEISSLKSLKEVLPPEGNITHIAREITRMEASLDADPELAIGTAKELVETVCRTVLHELGANAATDLDLSQLVKLTVKELRLAPTSMADDDPVAGTLRRLLGSLGSITQSVADLRNRFGTGHGKQAGAQTLDTIHARLAVGAASTLALFLHEIHQTNK